MSLRDYQVRTVDSTRNAIQRLYRRPLIVAPCGSGKTHIAGAIVQSCQANNARTLFFAPRRELVYQTLEKFVHYGIDAGMIMAGEAQRLYAKHQIASFDTLHARAIQRDKIPMPEADVVLVDEAHLSLSKGKQDILEHYRNKIVIGLTATPTRTDGTGMGRYYNYLVNEISVRELIDDGYLVEPAYYAPDHWDMSGVKTTKSDYVVSSLSKAVDQPELIGGIYENWKRLAGEKRTVIFCVNRKHSRHICELFKNKGIRAEHVDGETPKDERAGIFNRVRSGATQVLCNVYVASYGLDIPELECAVLARPTKSLGLYFQTCGRVLRPAPGKTGAIIIDHTGAVEEHGFLDDHIPWTLEEGKDIRELKKKQDQENEAPKEIVCTNCGNIFSGQRECPRCGSELIPGTEAIPYKKADLKKVDKTDPATFYAMLLFYAKEKKFKTGWANHTYHKKYGMWPIHGSVNEITPVQPNQEVSKFIKSRYIAYRRARA